jgi:hypothetical protein
MLYKYLTNKTLTSGIVPLNNPGTYTYGYEKLQSPTSKIYSFAGWMFLTGQTGIDGGYIFQRSNTKNDKSTMNIGLFVNGTTLSLYGGQQNNLLFTVTNQIPLQKWIYVVVNVNGDLVEVYLNGKIVKTVQFATGTLNNHFSATASLIIGHESIQGYMTQFIMVSQLLDASTVWKNYLNGNGLSNQFLSYFMPYNINMTVSKDDVVQRQFSIF